MKTLILTLIVSTIAVVFGVACGSRPPQVRQTPSAASPAVSPKKITPLELAKLRWIEGTWRGTGDTQKPFYERYRFEGDSTLVMEELADETLSQVKDVTRYELKNGEFSNGRYVATDLDDKSISFAPLTEESNSFSWQSESKDVWKAILIPAFRGTRRKEVVYKMERWPQK